MLMIWVNFLLEIMLAFFLKILRVDYESIAIIIVALNSILFIIYTFKLKKTYSIYVFLGFVIRIALMFLDVYGRKIYSIPSSGGDSEGYYNTGLSVYGNLKLIFEDVYGGMYSKFLGLVFKIYVPNRIIAQYINILLGMSMVFILYKILTMLIINEVLKRRCVLFSIFMPYGIIFSSILLRETLISLLVLSSCYFLIKWYLCYEKKYIVIAMTLSLIASAFHSGVIGMLSGYIFLLIFFQKISKKLKFSIKSIINFILIIIVISILYKYVGNLILYKLQSGIDSNNILKVYNYKATFAGSNYLVWLKADTTWQLILFEPIRMIYFMFSPLITDWRGISDIMGFFLDGLVYLYLIIFVYKNIKKENQKELKIGLIISVVVTIIIFSIGVSNAGTAMRHRYKIFNIILIIFSIVKNN